MKDIVYKQRDLYIARQYYFICWYCQWFDDIVCCL